MKLKIILAYLSLPLLWLLSTFIVSVRQNGFDIETLYVTATSGGFYFLPFLLWIAIARFSSLLRIYWHAGLVAASVSLAAIIVLSVWGPNDPSGLPYEWLLYWPLAAVLQVMFIGSVFLYRFSKRR